jgi:peptide/nickel transport system substrate-binding protein
VCWSVVGLFWLVAVVHGPTAATAAPVYGGQATVLNVFYPELWDPHMAGTIGPLAALSPLYNQHVEFNPLNPSEIIGDLAARWEVTENGLTYTFYLHDNVKWWDGKDLTPRMWSSA